MSENHEYVEGEVTDEAIEGFIDGGSPPSYHSILFVWRELLKPAADQKGEKITAGFANRIVSMYREIDFKDMEGYRDRYFDKILELAALLDEEIATDEECLNATTPEEDVAENSHHYKDLLRKWQLAIVQWEEDWTCTAPDAAIELAAISEVHKMFFGEVGITGYLDNIKLEITDADQAEMTAAINALREAQ